MTKTNHMSPTTALKAYAEWLMEQQVEEPCRFFRCLEHGRLVTEWYMIFYPVRTLTLAGRLLNEPRYIATAAKYVDLYLAEQLPNGAFTSNCRQTPTEKLTRKEFEDILRGGKVNLADNCSNVAGVLQLARYLPPDARQRCLAAVRKYLDEWVPVWALPGGGYGNGIWVGQKINTPYTCAMSTTAMALSFFGIETGEYEYIEKAEECMRFQCSKWLPDGRPINLNCYPLPSEQILTDFGHGFYLIEGMCWTHFVSKNREVKDLLAKRLAEWIFGEKGLLSQWSGSWFSFTASAGLPQPGERLQSRLGLRHGWELAKSNGILHAFFYYLRHIEDNPVLREKVRLGLTYLTQPLKARMSGVMSDPEESYGAFAVQATGFAGLSLAEEIHPDVVFMPESGAPKLCAGNSMAAESRLKGVLPE